VLLVVHVVSQEVSVFFCTDIVADIRTSQLNRGRHIILQHEQQVAQYNTQIYKNNYSVITPLHRGVFYQSSNLLGYKVYFLVINRAFKISPLVINLQVRDTTDCLGLLSETLQQQVSQYNTQIYKNNY
jgi:hypothetical protein